MPVSSSTSSISQFWSINHTSIWQNSEWNFLEKYIFLDKISKDWPKDLLAINLYKTLESRLQSFLKILQWTNVTLVISEWSTFSFFI